MLCWYQSCNRKSWTKLHHTIVLWSTYLLWFILYHKNFTTVSNSVNAIFFAVRWILSYQTIVSINWHLLQQEAKTTHADKRYCWWLHGTVAKYNSSLYKEIVQNKKPGTLFEPFWIRKSSGFWALFFQRAILQQPRNCEDQENICWIHSLKLGS